MADDTEPQPNPDALLLAEIQLDTAKAQLTQPSQETLHRTDPLTHPDAGQLAHDDRTLTDTLRTRHARHLAAHEPAQARQILTRLITHQTRVQQRQTTTAALPCLLDQLRDAVTSTTGAGGRAGVHRSPIGLAAVELLHTIQREIRSDGHTLTADLHTWTPHDVPRAATLAQTWVEQARTLLNPPRRWTHPGSCPDCGHNTATITDDTGQELRRPALELDRTTARVRCLRCPATWTTEAQLHQLARVLEQQAG